jgi:predicted kinase
MPYRMPRIATTIDRMKSGTLILITGTIGAGKTTLAEKLAAERNAHWFSPDDWVLAVLKDPSDIAERDRLRDPVEQMLWKEAQALLKLGVTVILENGFWTREERDQYLKTAKALGATVELHYVEAKPDELWERVQKRNSDPREFPITKEEVENALRLFQPPSEEEGAQYNSFKKYSPARWL